MIAALMCAVGPAAGRGGRRLAGEARGSFLSADACYDKIHTCFAWLMLVNCCRVTVV